MEDNKESNHSHFTTVVVVLLVLGVFILAENPFKTSRPEPTAGLISTAEDVRARLWQDPFEAVQKHRDNEHRETRKNASGRVSDEFNLLFTELSEEAFSAYQGPKHRVCTFSKLRDTTEIGDQPAKDRQTESKNTGDKAGMSLKPPIETRAHTIEELRCQIQRDVEVTDAEQQDLHILAVMVPGGPYAEDREARIRTRYAVISGLSDTGYLPADSEHIGYLDFAMECEKAFEQKSNKILCDWPAIMPYEWFNKETKNKTAVDTYSGTLLVLWVDDEEISQNMTLKMFGRLFDGLTPGPHEQYISNIAGKISAFSKDLEIKFDVIGPASSTTLLKMYREIVSVSCKEHPDACTASDIKTYADYGIRIISPKATLNDEAVADLLNISDIKNIHNSINIKRAIATDDLLVTELLCELLRRGINPYGYPPEIGVTKVTQSSCTGYLKWPLNFLKKQDHIVLVGEWDTVYSRNFFDSFKKHIAEHDVNREVNWIHVFNYFRGIDGVSGNYSSIRKASEKNESVKNSDKRLRQAVGEYQLDYLRRLGYSISQLEDSLENNESIRAIGIIGNDTYDKLLILQALRKHFPEAVFFSTDLDARMLHREENNWARNLIVASGCGLVPPIDAFKGMPFRDNYQTSTYMATRSAVLVNQSDKSDCTKANIFEVGNNGEVNYSNAVNYHGLMKIFPNSNGWLYLLLITGMFIVLLMQGGKGTRVYVVAIALVVCAVIGWMTIYDLRSNIEYNNMFSGTSIWPSIIIRMIATISTLIFISFALQSLKRNNNIIILGWIDPYQETFEIREVFFERIRRQLRTVSFTSDDVRKIARVILSELGTSISGLIYHDSYKLKKGLTRDYEKVAIWPRFFIMIWGWRYNRGTHISIEELFRQYLDLGGTTNWFVRVTVVWLLYMILTAYFIFSSQNLPLFPYNDQTSANAHFLVMIVSASLYVYLIFLVADVTRLNSRFVELLSRCVVEWPDKFINEHCNRYGISKEAAAEKFKLEIIVIRSKVVDTLIYLPFLILTLILVSRSYYFDQWHTSIQTYIVILLGAGIALSSAIRLRRTANKARKRALENLEELYKQYFHEENSRGNPLIDKKNRNSYQMSEKIRIIIRDIQSLEDGPFLPISKHPIVTSVFMPLGGLGGLYLIEYLATHSI